MRKSNMIIICLSLLSVTGSVIYYYWHQVTKLPDWYSHKQETQKLSLSYIADAKNRKIGFEQKIISDVKTVIKVNHPQPVKINVSETNINDMVIAEVAKKTGDIQLAEGFKAIKTTIKDGKIETGTVINISKIPTQKLSNKEKIAITKLRKKFPFLENREIYISLSGKPIIEKGQLKFDNNTIIHVGKLNFTIAEISQRIGISKEQIENKINLELKSKKLKLEDIQMLNNDVFLKGSSIP